MINVNIQTVPIDQIRPNPWNPNRQSDFMFTKERESIRRYGFIDPILVRRKADHFEIIDGEHRWRGAQMEGFLEIPINDLGEISDDKAKQLTIIMNELKGTADSDLLSKLMKSLESSIGIDEIVANLPYTKIEVDKLLANINIDWEKVESKPPSQSESVTGINLTFSNEDSERFMEAIEILQQIHGTSNISDTVLQTVLEAIKD